MLTVPGTATLASFVVLPSGGVRRRGRTAGQESADPGGPVTHDILVVPTWLIGVLLVLVTPALVLLLQWGSGGGGRPWRWASTTT